jgi:2,3,4,5-tetrahydropyridine-2-carboxylate N-succinyltransferase
MTDSDLQTTIDAAWEVRDKLSPASQGGEREAVEAALEGLDSGKLRVAEKVTGEWRVHQWLKKAVLLSFRLNDMSMIEGAAGGASWWDKVDSKFRGWGANRFRDAGFRAVPGAIVRRSAFIGKGVVLMPSFVNVGAHVAEGTMIDTWATVGSGAQVGRDVHVAGGVGIGGVLEPPGARPVIVEDGCFLGSRVVLTEGWHLEPEVVLGAGVVLTASTAVLDVTGDTAQQVRGRIPARSVVIPGVRDREFPAGTYGVPCALIIGQRSESTDRKTSLNDALRGYGVSV